MSDEVIQTIKQMAALTAMSNNITEIHEKNMKMYPLIFFNGIKSVKITFDLSRKQDIETNNNSIIVKAPLRNNFVTYHLTMADNVQNDNIDKRFQALESSIRTLFWKDIIIEVLFNDKTVYKSVNNGK